MPCPGFQKGHKKFGGRKKGSVNHDWRPVRERIQALGCDPIVVLALFANGDWKGLGYEAPTSTRWTGNGIEYEEERIPPSLRAKCAADLAQYVEPKLKSIEHSGKVDTGASDAVRALADELLKVSGAPK